MKVDEQIEILERIARDEQTNATARVTAIRALRQVEQDRGSDELDAELEDLIATKTTAECRACAGSFAPCRSP